jgi:hypothetical protein
MGPAGVKLFPLTVPAAALLYVMAGPVSINVGWVSEKKSFYKYKCVKQRYSLTDEPISVQRSL